MEDAFGTPRAGRASSADFQVKLPVSIQTAPDARKLGFGQVQIIIRFIAERGDYTTERKIAQANSGKGKPRGGGPGPKQEPKKDRI
jgi:hypothetical protein